MFSSNNPAPIRPYESLVDDGPPIGRRLFRPLVYTFEHVMLPQMFFQHHPEVQRALGPSQTIGNAFLHFWSKSAVFCEARGLWPQGLTEDAEAYYAYATPLIELVACVPTFEADYSVWTVRTPAPKAVGETYFVALCQRAGPQTALNQELRCITLERTFDPSAACLCEWTPNQVHSNYGDVAHQTSDSFTQLALARLRGTV